ncbi:hypothetical protein PQJ75_12960 [Rhodoplanes sp. TEM]|uniref:Secreted protein n=1 Tax=Rhodoplanes tepidamans TaxID=200616 RepID=A0ABT5J6K7_RHOTP|nr:MULTISPECIES: hypothetical protein [Rhodoplanes]MDC7785292.1 hypothetical protein [Rhodoplanes tepidamans]MDC7984641.1 hypothetical protein [Rhodoplanes sp. TEM]MDQ0353550.1 hypothetical protein [Rhodoplanes tepidamans]
MRAGLRACLIAGLLVLHWSALPLLGLNAGTAGGGTVTRGAASDDRTARPAIPVRDIVRAVATETDRHDPAARGAAGSSGDQAAVLPGVAAVDPITTATRVARAPRDTRLTSFRRAFDARGPPTVRA